MEPKPAAAIVSELEGRRRVRFEEERRRRIVRIENPFDEISTTRDRPDVPDMLHLRIITAIRSASVATGDKPRAIAASEHEMPC